MRIIFFQWEAFMQKSVEAAFEKLNIEYKIYSYHFKDWDKDDQFVTLFDDYMKKNRENAEAVFSINFSPLIAEVCNNRGIRYISWVYDAPMHIRRTDTMSYPTNRIFFFDRMQMQSYKEKGMDTVYHMPLGVNTFLYDQFCTGTSEKKYACDVAFVGQLYHSEFEYLCGPLDLYSRGYLSGLIEAQAKLYGGYILDELLDEPFLERLNKQYKNSSKEKFQIERAQLEYALATEITHRERAMALQLLGNRYEVHLHSGQEENLGSVVNMGYVDYESEMPFVFKEAKINLSITLKNIKSGIPLRDMDILGCGGFLLSNYQLELAEYFEDGVDLAMYGSMEELIDKASFYVNNETARKQIAHNGYEKVKREFQMEEQLKKIFAIAGNK